jgi:hypothetical protein
MHLSTAAAMEAAQRAGALPLDERRARSRRLLSESQKLRSIRASLGQYAAVGVQASVGTGVVLGAGAAADQVEGSGGDHLDPADPAPEDGGHDV